MAGSTMLILFGVPMSHTDDLQRAAQAALAIREIALAVKPPLVGSHEVVIECQIGMAGGLVFSAEIGEPRGRRDFNVLGDAVNTAARLMSRAVGNRIFMTAALREQLGEAFRFKWLGEMPLKGKTARLKVFSLEGEAESKD